VHVTLKIDSELRKTMIIWVAHGLAQIPTEYSERYGQWNGKMCCELRVLEARCN